MLELCQLDSLTYWPFECSLHKMVIKDFVEVMAGFELGKTIDSNSFMVGDTPMNITVYPNGNSSKTKGHVGLTLFNTGDASSSPM